MGQCVTFNGRDAALRRPLTGELYVDDKNRSPNTLPTEWVRMRSTASHSLLKGVSPEYLHELGNGLGFWHGGAIAGGRKPGHTRPVDLIMRK